MIILVLPHFQITMFECLECPELSFERRSLCARHMFEKHFGFECSGCKKIYNRPDNHQGRCKGREIKLKKRSTGTLTSEEAEEHRRFMRNINTRIRVVQKRQSIKPGERKEWQRNYRRRAYQTVGQKREKIKTQKDRKESGQICPRPHHQKHLFKHHTKKILRKGLHYIFKACST